MDGDHQSGDGNIAQQREAYFRELRRWLLETRQWHQLYTTRQEEFVEVQQPRDIRGGGDDPVGQLRYRFAQQPMQAPLPPHQQPPAGVQPGGRVYREYKIPSLWRRLVAEILDFFILLSIKLFLIIVSFEIATSLNLEDYWSTNDQQKIAIHLTLLEIFQALMSLCYETMFLSSTLSATPGKRYMGLQVLHVEHIVTPEPHLEGVVACFPAAQLTVGRALTRSVAKHVLCAFLLPVFYSFLTLGFNRARYDLYAGTLVVEYDPNPALHVY